MKIICEQSNLISGINIVLRAVPSKTTMEILDCIKISSKDEKISLTGNDMSLGIETIVKGTIVEGGTTVVSAKIFSDIIRSIPDGEVVITADDKIINKKAERKLQENIQPEEKNLKLFDDEII